MPADLPPPLRHRVPLWAVVVLGLGALGAGAVVLPMLRLDPLPRTQSAPDLAAPAPAADPPEGLPDAAPDPRVPRFDLVRTDRDGQTIVAGRTGPNLHVALVVDGETRAETRSDAAGQFVAFLMLDRSDAARVLWLVARDARGDILASADTVILAPDATSRPLAGGVDLAALGMQPDTSPNEAPSAAPPDMPRPSTDSHDTDGAALSAGRAPDDAPQSEDATPQTARTALTIAQSDHGASDMRTGAQDLTLPRAGTTPDPTPRASVPVQPLISDADGVRVMAPAPLAGDALRVDSVAYGAEGAVVLRGRATPGGTVRATLTGLPPAEVTPDADGGWTLRLMDVAPGDYRLDVARIGDPGDAATDTVTLPFRRADPADVDAALDGVAARVVTVQPGATLWAIARDRYGDGARYVQVYDANRGAITNPDLIYPGQIFRLPDAAPR